MNLILSTPTANGGGSLIVPSWGTAHFVYDGSYLIGMPLHGVTLETLSEALTGGPLVDCEVWFEDVREVTH